ncbi:MAG: hypothetical protein WC709_11920 [Thermoleophilia bacterium]
MAWLAELIGRHSGGSDSCACGDAGSQTPDRPGAATATRPGTTGASPAASCGLTCPNCGLAFETLALRCPRCAAPISFGCGGNCSECGGTPK